MELGRIPPNDVEAEQAILGCMLTDKDSVIAAMETLKEKKSTYDKGVYVKVDYTINNGKIELTEDINARNIKDLTTYYDLSTSYIGDKTNKDDVKGKLRDNNFTCK